MIRKTLFGLVAAAALSIGFGVAAPSEAKVFISIGFGHHSGYHHPFYHHCGYRRGIVRFYDHHRHRWVRRLVTRRICY
jgi:hypothetical protein